MSGHPHYSPEVWRRFRAPAHAGLLTGADTHAGEARTPASRAVLRLAVRWAQGRVAEARFQAHGCPSTIAAGEWLCERIQGQSLAELQTLTARDVADTLQLPPLRRHCAVMAEDALRQVLDQAGPRATPV